MVSNLASATVTWYDNSDGYVSSSTVSTDDIFSIPLLTDTGSGEVNEAEMIISAKAGLHVSSGDQIEEFDRFRFQLTDLDGNSYDRYFEVVEIIPSQTKEEGSILTIKMLGTEYHTQAIPYTGQHFYTNPFRVAKLIGNQYESNNGSRQPLIDRHDEVYTVGNAYGNGLPLFTINHYEFGLAEDNCYNRWMDLIDSLGGTVESGGVGDFFELGFDTPEFNLIDIALFVSGARTIDGTDSSNDASLITIENTDSINLSEQEGGIGNPTGTVVMGWGSPVHGTLPIDLSKYRAYELEFLFRPAWASGVDYKTDAKVRFTDGKHYKATSDHTSSASNEPTDGGAPWSQIDMSDEFGDDIQYSPWTDEKATLWANSGSAPDELTTPSAWVTATTYTMGTVVTSGVPTYVCLTRHTSGTFATDFAAGKWELVDNASVGNGAGFYDSNRVVDDEPYYRTWANEAIGDTDYDTVTDNAGDSEYTHSNNEWPLGHRMLNFGSSLTGSLGTVDRNGKSFTNALLERVVDSNQQQSTQWIVIFSPDSTTDKAQVAVFQEGKTYEWNNSASEWQDISTEPEGNDCFHQYKAIYNIKGADLRPSETNSTKYPEITKDGNPFSQSLRSAVEVSYEWSNLISEAITAAGYKKGAWLNFAFPFPINSFNSISEGVGDLFGGGTNEATPTQPSFLDIQNTTYTPTGLEGFNQVDSENLGAISSLSFMMRVAIEDAFGNSLGGKLNMRCCICDRKDNLVIQDFELKFSDGKSWTSFDLPISAFGIYRARQPKSFIHRALSATGLEVPLNDLDVQNVFEWRSIKNISFQVQDFYDDDGRYSSEHNIMDFSNTGFLTAGGGTIRLAIDGFHFKKVLLASSGVDSIRNITPQFLQRPNIISFNQLRNDVKSQLEIEEFKHKEFNIQTSGDSLFDLRFGDSFFLKNDDIVVDQDDSSNASERKIKLVAKRIEYHITKPAVGVGGVTRSIKGVKRFS